MTDAMFEFPSKEEKEVKITLSYAKKKLERSSIKKLKAA